MGVLTPLELLTAVLEKDPVVGMDWTKLPRRLQTPSATISWLASTVFPPARERQILSRRCKTTTN